MDIATVWNDDTFTGDYVVQDGALRPDAGLRTAVILSLFTDRRAAVDDILPTPASGRRGWWGSEYLPRPLGSRLWLLGREKQTQESLNRAREYALEALAWLVSDGIAQGVDAAATAPSRGLLKLEIVIRKPDGTTESFRFLRLWEALLVADEPVGVSRRGLGFKYDGTAAYDGTHDYSGML